MPPFTVGISSYTTFHSCRTHSACIRYTLPIHPLFHFTPPDMNRSLLFVLPVLLLLSAVSCKSTKRAYEKGDYLTAVLNSVDRLRRSPDNKKSRQTLKVAYPTLVTHYTEQIALAKQGGDPYKWETIMGYYQSLNTAYDQVKTAPAALEVIPNPQNFVGDYEIARSKAAEARYQLGNDQLALARNGDREAAKVAYDHFLKSQDFRPGYKDTEDLRLESLDLATIYIQIEPIPMHSASLSLTNEFFENKLAEEFVRGQLSPFIRFYFPGEDGRTTRQPDQYLIMQFDEFVVGQAYVKETVRERSRDSVVIGSVTIKEDSTANVYGTVEAEMHQFQKVITSSGLLDLRIVDARTGATITQQKFPGTYEWFDYWGFYNGDQRALNEEDQKFLVKKRESTNPSPQELFIEFTQPIYAQATSFVRSYYQNY